jgi:hypothetical protein
VHAARLEPRRLLSPVAQLGGLRQARRRGAWQIVFIWLVPGGRAVLRAEVRQLQG